MVNLYLLKESSLIAAIKNKAYQRITTQYHNARVNNKWFKFGDLVLKKLKATSNRES